jgi:hypothetical protein
MLALVLTLLSSGSIYAAGFQTGDEFVSTEIDGDLTVQCREGGNFDTAYFTCAANVLDPVEFDYFVTESQVDFNEVTLKNNVEGEDVKQTRGYNKNKNRSSNRFNLWIWSLTQTPILNVGENTIAYELKKSGRIVESGNFDVKVSVGQPRTCRRGFINSPRMSDCQNKSFVCADYFRQNNYCQ